jgi:hypothetical protein
MAHLRAVSAEDAAPDPVWIASVDELAAKLKLKAEGQGVFCVIEMEGCRTVFLAGSLDVDGIAGYAARVLAAVADGEV